FLGAALAGRSVSDPAAWRFAATMGLAIVALHALLLGLLATRRTVKPLVAVFLVLAAAGAYYMRAYGVFLDPSMLRNVVRTDVAEARELVTIPMIASLALHAGLPLFLLAHVRIRKVSWRRAAGVRAVFLLASAVVL